MKITRLLKSIWRLHFSNDKPPPGPNPTKTKPKSDDQLKRSAKPTGDRPHLQNKDSYHYCWSLLRQYTLSIQFVPITVLWIHRMKLGQTSIACISLLWRTSEEVQGLPSCADRPQDQRRRQKAMVGTSGCKATTASNQKKVTYQQGTFFFFWKSPEEVGQRGFMGPVMS